MSILFLSIDKTTLKEMPSVFIQSDVNNQWLPAQDWQTDLLVSNNAIKSGKNKNNTYIAVSSEMQDFLGGSFPQLNVYENTMLDSHIDACLKYLDQVLSKLDGRVSRHTERTLEVTHRFLDASHFSSTTSRGDSFFAKPPQPTVDDTAMDPLPALIPVAEDAPVVSEAKYTMFWNFFLNKEPVSLVQQSTSIIDPLPEPTIVDAQQSTSIIDPLPEPTIVDAQQSTSIIDEPIVVSGASQVPAPVLPAAIALYEIRTLLQEFFNRTNCVYSHVMNQRFHDIATLLERVLYLSQHLFFTNNEHRFWKSLLDVFTRLTHSDSPTSYGLICNTKTLTSRLYLVTQLTVHQVNNLYRHSGPYKITPESKNNLLKFL